jgi:hypothetical protein
MEINNEIVTVAVFDIEMSEDEEKLNQILKQNHFHDSKLISTNWIVR